MEQRIRLGVNTDQEQWDYVFSPQARARLHQIVDFDESLIPLEATEATIVECVEGASVIIGTWHAVPLSGALLKAAPTADLFIYGAGSIKHLLTPASDARGIRISTGSHVNARPVAEFALGLLLVGLKDVVRLNADLTRRRSAAWDVNKRTFPGGYNGPTILLVGFGEVTRQLLARLKEFDFEVLVSDPYATATDAEEYGFRIVDLDETIGTADVLSLHAADIPENENLLSADRISRMKAGSTLINTARGRLVDHHALSERLRQRDMTAFLDVTHPEPLPDDSPLYELENCLMTPHMAGSVGREVHRLGDYCVRELENHLSGKSLEHELDLTTLSGRA